MLRRQVKTCFEVTTRLACVDVISKNIHFFLSRLPGHTREFFVLINNYLRQYPSIWNKENLPLGTKTVTIWNKDNYQIEERQLQVGLHVLSQGGLCFVEQ